MPDLTAVKTALRAQRIELPSWAFGNTGTRFKVFAQPGVPRTPQEKIDDAAQVHKFTGVAPTVAVHIPWDKVDDYAALAAYARGPGRGHRHGQRQRVPGRRLQAGQRVPTRTRGCAARPWLTCWSAWTSWTPPGRGTSSCGSPTAPTTRARTTSAARQDRLAEALAAGLPAARRRPADAAGVQAVRAVVLHHRRARLGHLAAALPGAGPAGRGGGGHRAPRAGHQHRVHRGPAAAGRAAGRRSTSTPGSTPTTT